MRSSLAVGLALALALASLAALPRVAHACAPPSCSNAPSSIANGKIPSGTTGIPLPPGLGDPSGTFRIFDASNKQVAASLVLDDSFAALRADAPLADGTYTLVVPNRCADEGGPIAIPKVVAHPFEVSGAAKPPTSLGTLAVAAVDRSAAQKAQNDCQASTPEIAAAHLSFTPSDDLRPHLPLARLWLTVDGKPWASERFGGTDGPWTGGPTPTGYAVTKSIREVMAACGETPETVPGSGASAPSGFLAPGLHVVELHGKLAGAAAELAPLHVEVDLRCDAPWATVPMSEDDGTQNANASGCSAAGRASVPGLPFAGALAILAVLAGSMRRRPRSADTKRLCK